MSQTIGILIGLMSGIAIGCVIGWLFGLRRNGSLPADNKLESELRQQLLQREAEVIQQRETLTRLKVACATSDAQKAAAEQLMLEQRQFHDRALVDAQLAQEKAIVDLREAFKAPQR